MLPKIKIRLFGLFLLAGLLAVLYICFRLDQEAETAVFTRYQNSIIGRLTITDERISRFFLELAKETRSLAGSPAMRNAEGKSAETKKMQEILYPFSTLHEAVGNIHLLYDSGGISSLWKQPGWTEEAQQRKQLRIEFMRLYGENAVWLLHDAASPNSKSIYISQRIKNDEGVPFATLLVEIKLQSLSKMINAVPTEENHEQMIVTSAGKILFHTDKELLGKQVEELPYYREMKRDFRGSLPAGISFFARDDERVYAFQYVSPQNGYVYYEMLPGKEIEAELMRLKLMVMGIPLIAVALGGYVYYLFIRLHSSLPVSGELAPGIAAEDMDSRRVEQQQKGLDQIVRSFYLAVEMKDRYTAGHTERVTQYALAIYDQMGEEQKRLLPRDDLRYVGLLHDIGKVAIPDHILLKEGKLTEEEYEQIKRHPTVGANMVEQIESLAHVSPGVRYHHERWDGKGYPEQLKGEEIPLIGRILAVADTFDAMTSTRTYREALPAQVAYEEIVRCAHTQFDPYVVEMFVQAYEKGAIQTRQQEVESGQKR